MRHSSEQPRGVVLPEWTDYNGHMNVAYYALAFDRALDQFLVANFGMDDQYVKLVGAGPFALQSAYHYFAELLVGESFIFDFRILDFDEKRIHLFSKMKKEPEETLSATCETLLMNVDHRGRKAKAYSPEVYEKIDLLHKKTAGLPYPSQSGQPIQIRRTATQ